jgi:hypothetical protein
MLSIAQAIEPTGALDTLTNSGVLGATLVVMFFVSGYLLRLLLATKDERIADKDEMLTKQFELQQATNEVLSKIREDYRGR